MKDKFSLYQADGFWGIIEDNSDWKQSSVKSYIGPNLIVKRLNEQADQIDQLQQQLAEKQKTIDEINKEFVQAIHDWKTLCAEKDKEIERLKNLFELNNEVVINQGKEMFDLRVQVLQQKQNQTQLAIQELEKVKDTLKHFCNIHNDEYYGVKSQVKGIEQDVCDQINQQIKELKGDKDVED